MTCRVADRLPIALRGVGEAVRLDSDNHMTEAYVKYLACVIYIGQALVDDAARRELWELSLQETLRFFKMASQCLERAAAVVDSALRKQSTTYEQDVVVQKSPSVMSTGEPSSWASLPLSFYSNERDGPQTPNDDLIMRSLPENLLSGWSTDHNLEESYRRNEELMAAYHTRMKRLQDSHPQSADQGRSHVDFTLMRKCQENIAIARTRQQTLLQKMKERQQRLNGDAVSLRKSPFEEVDKNLCSEIQRFEQQLAWSSELRAKIVAHPDETLYINDFIIKALSTSNHPLAALLGQLQYDIHEKLLPLSKHAMRPVEVDLSVINSSRAASASSSVSQTPSGDDSQSPSLTHHVRRISKPGRRSSVGAVEPRTHSSMKAIAQLSSVMSSPNMTLSKSFSSHSSLSHSRESSPQLSQNSMVDDEETSHHHHGNIGNSLKVIDGQQVGSLESTAVNEESTLLQIAMDLSSNVGQGNAEEQNSQSHSRRGSTACRLELQPTEEHPLMTADSSEDLFGDSWGKTDGNADDTKCLPAPPSRHEVVQIAQSLCSSDELEQAENAQQQLKGIIHDMHICVDQLESCFMAAYSEMRSPTGRDQCRASIELRFFPPLWSLLLSAFRLANLPQEKALAVSMTQNYSKTTLQMGVVEQFALLDGSNKSAPYRSAVEQLQRITKLSCPLEKLECVVSTTRVLCECVEEHSRQNKKKSSKPSTLGCDELLPILGYVIIRSALPQLVSECCAMEEFIHEGYLMGEEGYCLTTLQTALVYVTSLVAQAT